MYNLPDINPGDTVEYTMYGIRYTGVVNRVIREEGIFTSVGDVFIESEDGHEDVVNIHLLDKVS